MSRFFSGKCIFSLCSHNSQLIHSLFCICVLLHCPCDEVDVLLLQCSSLTRYSKLTFLSSTCCNSPVDKCTKSDHKKHSLNSFHNCLLNFFITFLHPTLLKWTCGLLLACTCSYLKTSYMKIKHRQIKWKKRGSCPKLVKLYNYFLYLLPTTNAPYI
jgi:hypothetical protein